MLKKINPSVQFNNITIKPDSLGYYRCPYNCNKNTGYPSPKWKTEKGILNHLSKCIENPENILKNKIEKNNIINKLESLKPIYLQNLKYKLGDEIAYIKKIIIKDTTEWNGFRYVKVRYEPIIEYEVKKETIFMISFIIPDYEPKLEDLDKLVYFNNTVYLSDIHITEDYDMLCKKAEELTKLDEQNREFASLCR